MLNDKTQRSGGTAVGSPGDGKGAFTSPPGANTSRKNGPVAVPAMPEPPTGNTAPKGGQTKYSGIPDGN